MMQSSVSLEDIMNFSFISKPERDRTVHTDFELLYVAEGVVHLNIDNFEFTLKKDDIVVINPHKNHMYHSNGKLLLGRFVISTEKLCEIQGWSFMEIWCNSVLDKSKSYDKLRTLLKDIMNQKAANNPDGVLYLNSLYYQLLYLLTDEFLTTSGYRNTLPKSEKSIDRIKKIVSYIGANYRENIDLQVLSEALYLSPAYLSRYIKKQLGTNFKDYLNQVRITHAVTDLLQTDKSITKIALENGFSNLTAFNRIFKAEYGITPNVYRIQYKPVKKEAVFEDNQSKQLVTEEQLSNITTVSIDNTQGAQLCKFWNRMINIGTASDMLRSDVQKHILRLKEELKFKYVRFWDLYSPEMFLNINNREGRYYFEKLDRILDFLISNSLTPYIELGIKPKKLLKSPTEALIQEDRTIQFESTESLAKFTENLVLHLLNRYGIEELEMWYFELWRNEYDVFLGYEAGGSDSLKQYLDMFDTMAGTIKKYLPNVKVGGGGLTIRYGRNYLYDHLKVWKQRKVKPDFLSLYCYPGMPGDSRDSMSVANKDQSYLYNFLTNARAVIEEAEFSVGELHVSEWNSTVSNRNILNDSCYKGAFVMKNIVDSIGLVDMIGYWFGSDLFADFHDSSALLCGGCGLLSKDEIAKPTFYAFQFLGQLGKYIYSKGSNHIATKNASDSWQICCHNNKQLNYSYYTQEENEIKLSQRDQLFKDIEPKHFRFFLNDIENGNYLIKIRSLNTTSGSIQDEWARLSLTSDLTQNDIGYLKNICIPRLEIRKCQVTQGILEFDLNLEPNEMQYIHITRNTVRDN